MTSKNHNFTTAVFEDGICAVMRYDRAEPRLMEVIATFHDAARARDYAKFENGQRDEPQKVSPAKKPAAKASASKARVSKATTTAAPSSKTLAKAEPKAAAPGLSERQQAVLKALRSMMDKKNLAEVRAAELAKASSIPLGSLHSVLVSLEKKKLIRTERQGSAKFRAIYAVLGATRTTVPTANGAGHHGSAASARR
jgi:DNA-binding MarR family transcriptional regulator